MGRDASFDASFWSVRDAWRNWRKARGVRAEDVAIPVETEPGEIAQVDFGATTKLAEDAPTARDNSAGGALGEH